MSFMDSDIHLVEVVRQQRKRLVNWDLLLGAFLVLAPWVIIYGIAVAIDKGF